MNRLVPYLLPAMLAALALLALGRTAIAAQEIARPTKVGVVNLTKIFKDYDRVRQLRHKYEKEFEEITRRESKLEKTIKDWQKALNLKPADHDLFWGKITYERRTICDLGWDAGKRSKRLDDEMLLAWQEIDSMIQVYAKAHGYHLILAYGEPDPELSRLIDGFPKRDRGDGRSSPKPCLIVNNMAVEQGGATIILAAGGVDVTAPILASLNQSCRTPKDKKND